MKKLSESIWADFRKKSLGQEERLERKSNVKDMVPVDLGLSVLWADRNLEINGNNKFTIDEIKDFEPDGWRRPTREEADELLKCQWTSNKFLLTPAQMKSDGYKIMFHNNGNELTFSNCKLKDYEEFFERENTHEPDEWSTFTFKVDHTFLPKTVYDFVKLDEPAKVRFVKDK